MIFLQEILMLVKIKDEKDLPNFMIIFFFSFWNGFDAHYPGWKAENLAILWLQFKRNSKNIVNTDANTSPQGWNKRPNWRPTLTRCKPN